MPTFRRTVLPPSSQLECVQSQNRSQSHFATDGQSVRLGVDQILVLVKTVAVLLWGILPVERTGLSRNRSHSHAICMYICTFFKIWLSRANPHVGKATVIMDLINALYLTFQNGINANKCPEGLCGDRF
jgi:hypothetical protein